MKRRVKKILKYTLLSLLGLVLLVVGALFGLYLYLNSDSGHRWMARKAVEAIEKNAGVEASIGNIVWDFPATVTVTDVRIRDHRKAQMLKVGHLSARLAYYNFITKKITISSVGLDNVWFNLTKYLGDEKSNLGFVLERLTGTDTSATGKTDILVKSVEVKNINFVYDRQEKPEYTEGIDFNHVDIRNLNGRFTYLVLSGSDFSAKVRSLNFREKSGFVLEEFRTVMSYTRQDMQFSSLYLKTPNSRIRRYLKFSYNDPSAFSHFIDSVTMEANLRNSRVSMRDLAFFTNGLQNKRDQVRLTADVQGTVSKLKVRGLNATFGRFTKVDADVSIRGLPKVKDMFIDTRIRDLVSSRAEVMRLLPEAKLPEEIGKFGRIAAKGNFTGFVNDFVSYTTINTEIGSLVTDLNLKIANNPAYSTYSGKVKTQGLDIGKLLEQPVLGLVSANVQVNGKGMTEESIHAALEGTVQRLDIKGYSYQNLAVNGDIQNQFFNGKLTARDPNLDMDFAGTIDFSQARPELKFKADIRQANLRNLNLIEDTVTLVTEVDINMHGIDIDTIEGTMRANRSKIITPRQTYNFDTISLISVVDTGYREIGLYSDILQATLVGDYKTSQLPNILTTTANRYIDSSFMRFKGEAVQNQFVDFDIRFHDMEPLMQMLNSDFVLQDSGYVKGRITSTQGEVMLDGHLPGLAINGLLFRDIMVKGEGKGDDLDLTATFASLNQADSVLLRDFRLHTVANNDLVRFDLYTSDVSQQKEAKLRGSLDVVGSRGVLQFDSSEIVINDATWQLTAQPVTFYSDTLIDIALLTLANEKQQLRLAGQYAQNSSRTIRLIMENLSLTTVTAFLPQLGKVRGDLNGQVLVTDLNKQPIVEAGIYVTPFVYDTDTLGTLRASTNFDQGSRRLTIDATVQDLSMKEVLEADGTISFTSSQDIDLDIVMNQTNLRILEPAVNTLFSDLEGRATANMHVGGTLKSPRITGKIALSDAALKVNYLGTRYRFTHNLTLDGSSIDIKNLELRDVNNHRATLNGSIDVSRLDDVKLRLAIDPTNFQVLNTTHKDNEAFYGQVYATGYVSISGPTDNLLMYVKLRTERNSEFYMPLSQGGNFYGYDYITFIDKTKYLKERKKVAVSRLRMSMDLEITDGLVAQIIFDPRVGDLIEARGSGNLRLDINTEGDFAMYGVYTIDRGSYRFTAYDVIKKDFDIRSGSSISWTGSPYEAQMNVEAAYKVRTSIAPLVETTSGVSPADANKYYPVEARLKLTGELMKPEIGLDFEVQELTGSGSGSGFGDIETLIRKIKNDDQELNKQVVSLLVFNRFTPVQQGAGGDFNAGQAVGSGVSSGVTDLVNSQLNDMLSNAGWENVQVGVDYRRNEKADATGQENELSLRASTDLFSEKVNVSGAYDVTNNNHNAQFSYKLQDDGNVRGKVFSRSNNNPNFQQNSNTVGIGIFFRREFDSLKELFRSKKKMEAR